MLIDVVLLLILVACVLSGWRKGLLMSLMGLLVMLICILGATAAQNILAPRAVEWIEPRLEEMLLPSISGEMEGSVPQSLQDAGEFSISVAGQSMSVSDLVNFLQSLGLDVSGAVSDQTTEMVQPLAEATARGVAQALADQLSGVVIFFLAFLILYLILNSVVLAVNVVDRLPVIHTFNHMGGALLGLVGCLLVMVVGVSLCDAGNLLPAKPGPVVMGLQLLERLVLG